MAKKKKLTLTLYVDIDATVKRRIDRLSAVRLRKLNAEVEIALKQYLDKEEKRETNLPPLEELEGN